MKAATTALRTGIREAYEVKAVPKLIAEWEHNRSSLFPVDEDGTPIPVSVSPALTDDDEWNNIYTLNSIAEPNRPRTGIAKLRFREDDTMNIAEKYRDAPQATRYYFASHEDPYKYWSSPQLAGTTNDGGNYAFAQPIVLTVTYDQPVVANKVVAGFELSYARPTSYSIEVSSDGNNWTTITTAPALDVNGRTALWRNDAGNWVTTPEYLDPFAPVENGLKIKAVRLVVYAMNHASAHLDVIQLGARLEADLSDFIESYDKDFEIADRSVISPLGSSSSNTASVDLDNTFSFFNNDNEDSPFFGIVGKKVKFTLDLSYDMRPTGGADERIREFTMWVDAWNGQDSLSSTVELKDSSVYLQEMTVPKVFWGDMPIDTFNGQSSPAVHDQMTVGAVIWQLMDILGFSNYAYSREDQDDGLVVPYFWPEDENTAWDTISKLAEGTQTAVYFDEYDVMQIKPRNAIFGPRENIDWNLDAVTAGSKLADIIEVNASDDLAVNKIDITYKPTKFPEFNNGLPKMATAWEPEEETMIMRATALVRDLLAGDEVMYIDHTKAKFWPYEGYVNIRGEIIHYKGKEYSWRAPGGMIVHTQVNSHEKKQEIDSKSDEFLAYTNAFTGKLYIEDRGVAETEPANHRIRPYNYSNLISNWKNTRHTPVGANTGITMGDGFMTVATPSQLAGDEIFSTTHESGINTTDVSYGTRVRFPEKQPRADNFVVAGIKFAGDALDSGYYLEISTTETIDKHKRPFHEISLVAIPAAGNARRLVGGATNSSKGSKAAILRGKWYDIDIRHRIVGTSAQIAVYLDGVNMGSWNVPLSIRDDWMSTQGRFGLFARYNCRMDVEYLYAFDNQVAKNNKYLTEPDKSNFLDLLRGGFTSGYAERDWRYRFFKLTTLTPFISRRYKRLKITTINSSTSNVIDEFGPVVHEMRQFKIKFNDNSIPTAHSFLYFSNQSQIDVLNYISDPFGATFSLVNASRRDAVLRGQDEITFGKDNAVDQTIFVYGRSLLQEDEQTITKEDQQSIRRSGLTATTFDNRFVQNKEAAEALAQWVVDNWAEGVDELEVEIFGNPLLQLGDKVTVNYPIKDMLPNSHQYFVVKLSNSFDEGLTTHLILRRAKT